MKSAERNSSESSERPDVGGDERFGTEVPVREIPLDVLEGRVSFMDYMSTLFRETKDFGGVRLRPHPNWNPLGIPRSEFESYPTRLDAYKAIYKGLADQLIKHPIRQEPQGGRGFYSFLLIEQDDIPFHEFEKKALEEEKKEKAIMDARRRRFNKAADRPLDSMEGWTEEQFYTEFEDDYWKRIMHHRPLYGADLSGTLFNQSVNWNLNSLNTILDIVSKDIKGVTSSYLYFGMHRSTFAWHIEDMNLPAINYNHFGAAKKWYVIPEWAHEQFENFCRAKLKEEFRRCPEYLRHKTTLVSPFMLRDAGVPIYSAVQQEGEFIIVWPVSYHCGFNTGFNCAEAVNFAFPEWLPFGEKAQYCLCTPDSVRFDIEQFKENYEKVRSGEAQLLDFKAVHKMISNGGIATMEEEPAVSRCSKVSCSMDKMPSSERKVAQPKPAVNQMPFEQMQQFTPQMTSAPQPYGMNYQSSYPPMPPQQPHHQQFAMQSQMMFQPMQQFQADQTPSGETQNAPPEPPPKRKRGRPRKYPLPEGAQASQSTPKKNALPKKAAKNMKNEYSSHIIDQDNLSEIDIYEPEESFGDDSYPDFAVENQHGDDDDAYEDDDNIDDLSFNPKKRKREYGNESPRKKLKIPRGEMECSIEDCTRSGNRSVCSLRNTYPLKANPTGKVCDRHYFSDRRHYMRGTDPNDISAKKNKKLLKKDKGKPGSRFLMSPDYHALSQNGNPHQAVKVSPYVLLDVNPDTSNKVRHTDELKSAPINVTAPLICDNYQLNMISQMPRTNPVYNPYMDPSRSQQIPTRSQFAPPQPTNMYHHQTQFNSQGHSYHNNAADYSQYPTYGGAPYPPQGQQAQYIPSKSQSYQQYPPQLQPSSTYQRNIQSHSSGGQINGEGYPQGMTVSRIQGTMQEVPPPPEYAYTQSHFNPHERLPSNQYPPTLGYQQGYYNTNQPSGVVIPMPHQIQTHGFDAQTHHFHTQ